jgi:hypothetical protein
VDALQRNTSIGQIASPGTLTILANRQRTIEYGSSAIKAPLPVVWRDLWILQGLPEFGSVRERALSEWWRKADRFVRQWTLAEKPFPSGRRCICPRMVWFAEVVSQQTQPRGWAAGCVYWIEADLVGLTSEIPSHLFCQSNSYAEFMDEIESCRPH